MSDYGFVHDGRVFTPNGTTGLDATTAADRNKAIEAGELARWAMGPDRQLAYYHFAEGCRGDSLHLYSARTLADCTVTTWLGTKLGTITKANVYRHNFGGRMVSLTVIGTNGHVYHGRASYDWGECVQLRRAKSV